jgi:D-gamma-glutamyl-meso-diaminopimelic acid endopeptidase CwlS
MACKKLIIAGVLSIGMLFGCTYGAFAQSTSYTIRSGDTFYLISQRTGVPITDLMKANNADPDTILYPGNVIMIPSAVGNTVHTVCAGETYWTISKKYEVNFIELLKANNANEKSWLDIGDKVLIPASAASSGSSLVHTVQAGDTFYLLSKKYNVSMDELMRINNATSATILQPGQKLQIPSSNDQNSVPGSSQTVPPVNQSRPYVTYTSYTVKSGDTLWSISNDAGIQMSELLEANNMTESTWLTMGQVIKIPVHHVPVKSTPDDKYGEYLDWWTEAQYVVPVQSILEIVDFYTGKSFKVKRTTGSCHADVETLTAADSQKMKEIWGGTYSWNRRPVIVKINGRKIAASMSSLPHAGDESAPGGINVSWRSDNYGPGYNLDWVKGNAISGVVDLHFANSVRHMDGLVDTGHQDNIKIAAGIK